VEGWCDGKVLYEDLEKGMIKRREEAWCKHVVHVSWTTMTGHDIEEEVCPTYGPFYRYII
jgi:hypothetical protein